MAGQESHEEIKPRSMVTTTGYWYSDHSSTPSNNIPNLVNHQLQSFETNPEIYNLTSGMEMIGFPSNNPQVMWKGNFFNKNSSHTSVGPSSSNSKSTNEQFYQHGNFTTSENMLLVSPTEDQGWNENNRLLVDDPSLRCVFPCEGNERPSQGLSLSLCSSNPSSIGLQSFELRHQQQIIQDGFLGKAALIFFSEVLKGQENANAASGMAVHDDCKLRFLELKAKRTHRFIVFKIEEKQKQVVVEKVGEPAESYEDFAASLPDNECRYAVYDFDFVTAENCQKSRIFFIAWSPDTSRVRSKMIYASSKDRFKRELDGIQVELQATDPTEMGLDVIKSRAN